MFSPTSVSGHPESTFFQSKPDKTCSADTSRSVKKEKVPQEVIGQRQAVFQSARNQTKSNPTTGNTTGKTRFEKRNLRQQILSAEI